MTPKQHSEELDMQHLRCTRHDKWSRDALKYMGAWVKAMCKYHAILYQELGPSKNFGFWVCVLGVVMEPIPYRYQKMIKYANREINASLCCAFSLTGFLTDRCWHFGRNNSLLWALSHVCMLGYSAAPLASAHSMPVALFHPTLPPLQQ